MRYHIKNALLVDPFQEIKKLLDNFYVEDGQIVSELSGPADQVLEARGLCLMPGFIDAHTHLRDPGQCYKEDIVSGTRAAAAGGFVAVAAMPNTTPVCDSPEIVRYMREKARSQGSAEVLPIAAVSMGEEGDSLSDFAALKAAGAVALTDDGRPVATAFLMREALKLARKLDLVIIDHPEESSLSAGTAVNLGPVSRKLNLKGMPNSAEAICVARDILLSQEVDAPIHLCHLSTKESVALLRWAKSKRLKVTADTCPHYFCLNDEALLTKGSLAKMYPPLRSNDDRIAIAEAVIDGTIELIATDHAPHSAEEKGEDIATAKMGIVGLETAFPLSYSTLCLKEGMPLEELLARFTLAPARLLKLQDRALCPGNPANFTLVDLDCRYTVREDQLHSKSKNSPFIGWELQGKIMYTFWEGRMTHGK